MSRSERQPFAPAVWQCRDRRVEWADRALVMGVLNVTPDSFSDGGCFVGTSAAIERALRMVEEGADIIDIGGESSRPGAQPVSVDDELRRVIPVVEAVARAVPCLISVDTTKPEVAAAALRSGAHIVNDITALEGDPRMAEVVASFRAGLVLMHMQGEPRTMQASPRYDNVVAEVSAYLRGRLAAAEAAGIARECVVLDPGIGFGKTAAHNVELLANLPRLAEIGRPLLVGLSRKSFLGRLLDIPDPAARGAASLAGLAYAALRGASILRVHDVKESCDTLRLLAILTAAE